MPNYYKCSNGEKVSEATIKARLSAAYRKWYEGEGVILCAECGKPATETSHIIAKARCKELHQTQLIWTKENTFPACRDCHMLFEAFKNPNIWKLPNYEKYLTFIKQYDEEDYERRSWEIKDK